MSSKQHHAFSCPVCTLPFALPSSSSKKDHTPKHLRCGHSICLSCLVEHCLTDDRRAVICLKCTKRTYLEAPENYTSNSAKNSNNDDRAEEVTPENGLITNYRFLMAEHSSMSNQNANAIKFSKSGHHVAIENDGNEGLTGNDTEDDTEEDVDDGLSFLADCEAPGCEEKATGRCEGCGGAAFCQECFNGHLKHLPKSVQEKHNFGSVADSQLCPKHKLPRQLFCMTHKKAVCATCATLHHRSCRELRELTSVVETLRPRILERQEKMMELFKVALTSCYELKNEMNRIDTEAEKTIADLLENARKCVEASLQSAFQVQQSAIQRKLELDQAFRTLSVEAGSFAEEVEEIKMLFDENENKHPDPVKVARHAPAEKPALHTIIPTGRIIQSELLFDVRQDRKQYWKRRGAAAVPSSMRRKSQREIDEEIEEFIRSSYSSTSSIAATSAPKDRKAAEAMLMKTAVMKIDSRFGKSQGTDDQSFNFPKAVSTLPNGNLAVCDMQNHRIQIIDPTTTGTSAGTSGSGKAKRKRDQQIGAFVGFIPVKIPGQDPLSHPAFPSLMCTLPNGILFILDNENRCGYFVDAMDKFTQVSSPTSSASPVGAGAGVAWNYPSAWQQPTGLCVLPDESQEIVVIDEPRHVVSVLDKTAEFIVREFDGVEMIYHQDRNRIGPVERAVVANIHTSYHHHYNEKVHANNTSSLSPHHNHHRDQQHSEDMIHRIFSPKAVCAIPIACPWGDNVFDTLYDDQQGLLAAIDEMIKNHEEKSRRKNVTSSNSSSPSSSLYSSPVRQHEKTSSLSSDLLPEEEDIRLVRKRLKKEGETKIIPEVGENGETIYTHVKKERPRRTLIAVCSESFVSLLDAHTGEFIRFIGGDLSELHQKNSRMISRPWGIASSEDGKRIVIVDGAHACLYVANVNDGRIVLRLAHKSSEQLLLSNQANLISSGSSVGGASGVHHVDGTSTSVSSASNIRPYNAEKHSSAASSAASSTSPVLTSKNLKQLDGRRPRADSEISQQQQYRQQQQQQMMVAATGNTFFPQNVSIVPANGKIFVTDIVSHSVFVMDAVL